MQVPLINSTITGGILFGNFHIIGVQIIAILVVASYTFTMTYVIAKTLDRIFGLRVEERHEIQGLNINQHEESEYRLY